MAKAQFHKNQRVFVKPVGTWALIESVRPQWAKGLDEPIRIFYDVGLGRDFGADELVGESVGGAIEAGESWRVVRARNKWQPNEDCGHHPHPGTYPVIVTGDTDWGGWRVPGAEYDLYPDRIESQAQIMANALRMFNVVSRFVTEIERNDENYSEDMLAIAREAKEVLRIATPQEKK